MQVTAADAVQVTAAAHDEMKSTNSFIRLRGSDDAAEPTEAGPMGDAGEVKLSVAAGPFSGHRRKRAVRWMERVETSAWFTPDLSRLKQAVAETSAQCVSLGLKAAEKRRRVV